MGFGAILAIAAGGAIGALSRHYLSSAIYSVTPSNMNWGILVVNVLGGFAMGLIVEAGALKLNYSPELRSLLITGMLGGFTTFSTFSLDSALLIEKGDWANAAFYIVASVLLSIGALFAGMWIVRSI